MNNAIDKWTAKVNANGEAIERWTRKLLRAAKEIDKLRQERKRLLSPRTRKMQKPSTLQEIEIRMAAGGDTFNDEIPI